MLKQWKYELKLNKPKQIGKQSNKQNLVQLDKVFPSGVVILSRVWVGLAPWKCASWEVLLFGKEMGIGLIIRLQLRFKSRHLLLWLLGTYSLQESG
jgi:hypothetical protein